MRKDKGGVRRRNEKEEEKEEEKGGGDGSDRYTVDADEGLRTEADGDNNQSPTIFTCTSCHRHSHTGQSVGTWQRCISHGLSG